MPQNKETSKNAPLRAGSLTDTPTEQPIPKRWGGASTVLPTLQPPIGQTASVTMPIGRLCLSRLLALHFTSERTDWTSLNL